MKHLNSSSIAEAFGKFYCIKIEDISEDFYIQERVDLIDDIFDMFKENED